MEFKIGEKVLITGHGKEKDPQWTLTMNAYINKIGIIQDIFKYNMDKKITMRFEIYIKTYGIWLFNAEEIRKLIPYNRIIKKIIEGG